MELMSKNDRHGRNELLMEYIQYQAHLPHPDLRQDQMFKTGTVDDEVGNIMRNGEGKKTISRKFNFTSISSFECVCNIAEKYIIKDFNFT